MLVLIVVNSNLIWLVMIINLFECMNKFINNQISSLKEHRYAYNSFELRVGVSYFKTARLVTCFTYLISKLFGYYTLCYQATNIPNHMRPFWVGQENCKYNYFRIFID